MALKAAVVGAGRMGRWHAKSVARTGGVVVAVVDADPDAAAVLASETRGNPPSFAELETCLTARPVDVVHVCTPLPSHAALASLAIEAGCHVIVEKPLAASPAETARLLDAARERAVAVAAVHQFPFQRGVRNVLDRRGALGDLVRVAYRTSSAGGVGRSPAARDDLLAEIVPHAASLFHRFAADFDPLDLEIDIFDDGVAIGGRSGGTRLDAFITLSGRPPCNELLVTGTLASAVADLFHGYATLDRVPATGRGKALRPLVLGSRQVGGAAMNAARLASVGELGYPGLRSLIRAFYASVEAGAPAPVPAAEIMAAATLTARVADRVADVRSTV
jgi:predicted dehydrogenase